MLKVMSIAVTAAVVTAALPTLSFAESAMVTHNHGMMTHHSMMMHHNMMMHHHGMMMHHSMHHGMMMKKPMHAM